MNFVFEKIARDGVHLNFVNCDDIIQTGFRRFTACPSSLTMIQFRASDSKVFKKFAEDIKVLDDPPINEKYIISSGVAHSPNDWCGIDHLGIGASKYQQVTTLFSFLNSRYIADLQSGKAFLLLDQSHEGYQTEWLWSWFHNNCDFYKINPKQIIYLTGNLNCNKQYMSWADSHKLENRILVIGYPHFELMIYDTMREINRSVISIFIKKNKTPLFKDHIKYKECNLDKIKTFSALQKRSRSHRIWFFKYLNDAGLLNNNIISMNKVDLNPSYYEGRFLAETDYKVLNALTPILPQENPKNYSLTNFADQDCGMYMTALNENTMLDTWLTVVSEASFGEDTCFLSEKTFKPIACCHPFIIVGNKGSLESLRELGYKTFHPFIDETYDILDTWDRMDAIIRELIRIDTFSSEKKLEWFKQLQPILEHNYNILHLNSRSTVPSSFQRIKNYVSTSN